MVRARCSAGHVIINGRVRGPVHADELLELQPKARIVGDVHYEALEMHQGATIDGELQAHGRPRKNSPFLEAGAQTASEAVNSPSDLL